MATVRDGLWLWGHDAGSHNDGWGLPSPSRITPTDAASYLGVPNLIMVRYKNRPPLPLDQFAVSLRALRQVVWSAVGAHGESSEAERAHILDVAARNPNVTGIMLDDFFIEHPAPDGQPAALSLDMLCELRDQLVVGNRRLDLWAVVYGHQIHPRLAPFLELMDVVSLWEWDAGKLPAIGDSLERLEALAPPCRKVLGCYMWDYGGKQPMPLHVLQGECETGLELLRQRRIESMIFLASCICDLGLDAVEWTRSWIAQVGDQCV
jgi:hypothetical protein